MKISGDAGDETIQEMIRTSMQGLSEKSRGAGISKMKVLKILFRAKKSMPDDNPIKRQLAYYWYVDGPYSEVVVNNLNLLVDKGVVIRSKTDAYETYKLAAKYALMPLHTGLNEHAHAAKKEVRHVVDKFVNIDAEVEEIYEEAPFGWYTTYKREFMPTFESYCRAIIGERDNRYATDEIANRLDAAVLDYPLRPEFMGHRRIFMDFSKMLNAFLYSSDSSSDTRKDMPNMLQDTSVRIWKAFAKIVRISSHDDYYDDRVEEWEKEYKSHIGVLDKDITEYVKKFESVADDRRLAPEVEDVILHPERHDFRPIVMNEAASPGTYP